MSFTSQRHNIHFGVDAVAVKCYTFVRLFVMDQDTRLIGYKQGQLLLPSQVTSTNTLIHYLDLTFPTRKLSAREEETY
jgi:hypothetical protein